MTDTPPDEPQSAAFLASAIEHALQAKTSHTVDGMTAKSMAAIAAALVALTLEVRGLHETLAAYLPALTPPERDQVQRPDAALVPPGE